MKADYSWIVLLLLFLYEVYMYLIKRSAGRRMEEKYTGESLKKYLVWAGMGSVFGAIGSLIFLLSSMGVIKAQLDFHNSDSKASWIALFVWAALIIVPCLIGFLQLKKKSQTAGGSKGSKNVEDEDF